MYFGRSSFCRAGALPGATAGRTSRQRKNGRQCHVVVIGSGPQRKVAGSGCTLSWISEGMLARENEKKRPRRDRIRNGGSDLRPCACNAESGGYSTCWSFAQCPGEASNAWRHPPAGAKVSAHVIDP